MMSRNIVIGVLLFLLVIFFLAVWLGILIGQSLRESPYSAVYLATGDVYFGRLTWFPQPKLTDVWYLERVADAATGRQELAIFPLAGAFWKPKNEINLNPKQIVFWTRLEAGSDLSELLQNPALREGRSPVPSGNFPLGQATGTLR
jgi:hypothetical protein